jgi:fimbrial isopeptide formation D2 family protein
MGVFRKLGRRFFGIAAVTAIIFGVSVPFGTSITSASGTISASLSQCTNGAVGSPLVLEQCAGANGGGSVSILNGVANNSGYANWVSGNSNGQKSHWREGDFIAYRTEINAPVGPHTLQLHYDTVHSGGHAIDYLGSYDATETTSTACPQPSTDHYATGCAPPPTGSALHANYSNPCADLQAGGVMSSGCTTDGTAPTPTATSAIPAVDTSAAAQTCGGSGSTGNVHNGTFTQQPGTFDLFGPSGSSVGTVSYVAQNTVSGTGQCSTTVAVQFCIESCTAGTGSATVVMAWGGHIASAADWGSGNSASSISGSPYHMALDNIDGTTLGSQDRALATSAIFFTPTVSTTIINNTTNLPVSGTLTQGTVVHDTATLNGADSSAGGTITFTLRNDTGTTACTGTVIGTPQTVTISPGGAATYPNSVSSANYTTNLGGSFSYQAVYSGDSADIPGNFTSACEPFTVLGNTPTLSTQAQASPDNTTFNNVTGSIAIGSYVRDTASLSGAAVPTTGSVTYTLYSGTSCTANTPTGTSVFTNTQTLASNAIPPSASTQLLTAGTYQWQAVYTSGNSLNAGATSACGSETFTVAPNSPTLSTQAQSSTDNTSFSNVTGSIAIGSYVRDTATLNGAATPTTGTVAYTLYNGTGCTGNTPTGTTVFTNTQTLASNAIPPSSSTQLLTAGSYQWQAVYTSGNGQNNNATSTCGSETFTVGPNSPTLATQAQSSTDNVAFSNITGAIAIGTYVRDTATLLGQATPVAGSVAYTLYKGTSCSSGTPTGSVVFSDSETAASDGTIPASASTQLLSAGTYQWQAVFSSTNGQNNGATSPCGSETFTVCPNAPTLSTQAQSSSDNVTFTNVSGAIAIGSYVRDTATLTGAATPTTGSVVYTLYSGTNCWANTPTGTIVFTDTENLASNTIPPSLSTQLLTAGSYQWQAVYTSGNDQNKGATSTCGSETFTVGPNSPTLATQAQSSTDNTTFSNITGTIAIGSYVRDTATLSGAATPTTGTVVYTLYNGTGCTGNSPSGTVAFTDTETLASNTIPPSASTQLLSAGTYQWQAVYTSGNGQNGNATSTCGSETFVVQPNSPTLATQAQSSSDNTTFSNVSGAIAIGSWVRDTATLSGAATPTTGSVVYTLYSGTSCVQGAPTGSVVFTSTKTLASNAIPPSGSTQLLTAGTYQWQAVYTSGNGQNNGATSPCGSETFTVEPNSPTLATQAQSSSDNTTFSNITGHIAIGSYVRDTATLTGAATPTTGSVVYTLYSGTSCDGNSPTGSVVFTDTENLASNAIPPSASTQLLSAGTYQWQAVYTSGNGQNNGATSPCGSETFTVGPNAPTLSTQAQSSSDNVTFTNVSGAIAIGSWVRDTATLTGAATPTTGSVVYTLYSGTSCDGNSPTGSVVFTDTENLASNAIPPSGSTQLGTAGTYQWQAVYTSGNGQNTGATSPCGSETFTVGPNAPTLSTATQSSADNSTFSDFTGSVVTGTYVRDTATLSGAATPTTGSVVYTLYSGTSCDGNSPTGSVVFTDTENLASNAIPPSASTQLLTAGSYQWQAAYTSGNGQNTGATSPCGSETFSVTQPNFTVTKTDVPGDGNPVQPGSSIPYTVTIQNVGDGPGTATITDTIPSNLTIDAAPNCSVTTQSDFCHVANPTGTTWTFTVSLAAGSTATVTFSATVSATTSTDVVNTATITSGRCVPTSTQVPVTCSSTVTNPVPNFTVTKTDTPGNNTPVPPGSIIPYTVAIKNVGDGAGTATITDTIPSELTIVNPPPTCAVTKPDTCHVANPSGSTWTFAVSLAAGNTATVTFSATVAAGATGMIVNTATITTGPCNTSSGCSSTVSNPVIVTAPTTTTTTTTTAPLPVKPAAIAFTGADIAGMVAAALALLGLGGLMVAISRRRRRTGETP